MGRVESFSTFDRTNGSMTICRMFKGNFLSLLSRRRYSIIVRLCRAWRHCTGIEQIAGPKMMRLNPFGGGATNERPAFVKASSSDDQTSKCSPTLNTRRRCMEDVYKARCADLERQIVQLKLELAEAKVRKCVSSFFSDASLSCYMSVVLPRRTGYFQKLRRTA